MTEPKKTPQQIAIEHWEWAESILFQQRQMEKKLYIGAFVHGFKHGKEDNKRWING